MSETPSAMPTPADEDSGVLDDLSEVVDVVLGEDLAPADPEDPWERRQRILDSWTAIILAIAAVATAWASFQASQWSGAQSDAQSASAIARADAGRSATLANQAVIIDSQMWLSWIDAVNVGDRRKAGFLDDRFSPSLKAAQTEWVGGVTLDANGVPVTIPSGTPLDLPTYVVPEQVASDEGATRAEALLAEADVAATNSTQFVLIAVLLAMVLFFASIATKFVQPKVQVMLTLVSLVILTVGVLRMLRIDQLV